MLPQGTVVLPPTSLLVRQDPKVVFELRKGVRRQKATTRPSDFLCLCLTETTATEHAKVALVTLLAGRTPAVLAGAYDEPVGCLF